MLEKSHHLLVGALLSAERLYLIYESASYFEPKPFRSFLDSLWRAISHDQWPTEEALSEIQDYLSSPSIPEEGDCQGTDFYGLAFVSAVQLLYDWVSQGTDEALTYLAQDLEIATLDHYLHAQLFHTYSTRTREQELTILNDPRMKRLESQLLFDWESLLSTCHNKISKDKISSHTFNLFSLENSASR